MKEAHALRIELAPSRVASALICVASLATATLVAWLPVGAAVRAPLVIGTGVHAIVVLRRCATRSSPRAIVGIEIAVDRTVRMTERSGERMEGVLRADSYVSAWVTTVVMRPEGRHLLRSTVVLPDMLAAEDFRRLRLMLRLGHGPATAKRS
jgi:hypothetical protein